MATKLVSPKNLGKNGGGLLLSWALEKLKNKGHLNYTFWVDQVKVSKKKN